MSDIVPITRPSVGNPIPKPLSIDEQQTAFPTETINLPSRGWFYSNDNPLSSGTLELKMLTAREEDLLTSKNLIQKNIVLDKLLEAVVINRKINVNTMFVCDRNAAFYAIRRLAYGDMYNATITCNKCGKDNEVEINLGKMDNKPFIFENYTKGENCFTYQLPVSKVTLTYKMMTKLDEDKIEEELNGLQKIDKNVSRDVTTRMSHIITSVDGNSEIGAIRKFVNERFMARDSLAFRSHLRLNMPDIDSSFLFKCQNCEFERKEETPMGVSFFWPDRAI